MLPDPALEDIPEKKSSFKKYRKRKRGNFGHFTPESRAKIAKWACEYGYTSVAKRFSKELMRDVNESTIRLNKKQYLRELQNSEDGNCTSLHEDPLLG